MELIDLLRKQGGQYLRDIQPGGMLSPEIKPGVPTETLKGLLGLTPGIGDAISGYDAIQSAREGNYGEAALNALGVLPFVPAMGGVVKAHRGIVGGYDPAYKQPIEWWSEGKDLAKGYGPNVISKEIDPKTPADLGLRDYRVEVKKNDVLDRLRQTIIDRFNKGEIDKDTAVALNTKINGLRGGGEFKPAHQWINSPEIIDILKGAGYDSLEHTEKGVKTYGVFK